MPAIHACPAHQLRQKARAFGQDGRARPHRAQLPQGIRKELVINLQLLLALLAGRQRVDILRRGDCSRAQQRVALQHAQMGIAFQVFIQFKGAKTMPRADCTRGGGLAPAGRAADKKDFRPVCHGYRSCRMGMVRSSSAERIAAKTTRMA